MTDTELINEFLISRGYLTSKSVLGVIFYGSSNYKTANKNSDIDLLIITDDSKNYKGVTYINGKRVEFFLKNIYYIEDKIMTLEHNPDRSLISIFENGTIIFSKNETIAYLKDNIMLNCKFRKKKSNNISTIKDYQEMLAENEYPKLKEYLTFNLLEQIRKFYHKKKGYSKLPSLKVYDLYRNRTYAKNYYCANLPDEKFCTRYLELIENPISEEVIKVAQSQETQRREEYFIKNHSKQQITYESTIISTGIEKCKFYEESNHSYFNMCFYLILERIRRLYCHQNSISDNILKFGEDYDDDFLSLFNKCLISKETTHLEEIFRFLTKELEINYRDYKILELA